MIVTTDGPKVLVVLAESDTDDVLGVTSVGAGDTTVSAGESEEVDKTVIVTSGDDGSVGVGGNTVDVGAIGALGVDTLSGPGEVDALGGPDGSHGVGSATGVLVAVGDGEEEEFVSTTVSSDEGAVFGPVEAVDVRGVTLALADEGEVIGGIVDVD